MKTIDQILSHMDNKMWGAKNYNTIEKLLRAFHMQEMRSEATVIYLQGDAERSTQRGQPLLLPEGRGEQRGVSRAENDGVVSPGAGADVQL